MKQLTLRITDRPGVLSDLASSLWGEGVSIRAFAGDIRKGKASIHLIVDKPREAREVFAKRGWNATEETVAVLTLADKPARWAAAAGKLEKAGINIEHAYSGVKGANGKLNFYLVVSDLPAALRALR